MLGLASVDEIALLERMRYIYPELETEISIVEYKLQKIAEEGGIAPPAQVWNRIAARISWERPRGKKGNTRRQEQTTYVIHSRNYTMTVSIWWRCAIIAMGMLIMGLLATTIYFHNRYHQLEERLLRMYPPTAHVQ